jgi:aminopeptidase N
MNLKSMRVCQLRGAAWSMLLLVALIIPAASSADEPYARSRDYDLQNARTHLWFDLEHHGIRGETTQSVAMLRDGLSMLKFDSVDLNITAVTLDGKAAKFNVVPNELDVSLVSPSKRGDRHEISIRYNGVPKKGVYYVFPDKNYPNRPKEIWTQGESEDTRYYIPIYDYPNDRTTWEMLLTVPANWITVSNGKLIDKKTEADGNKTWDWRQAEPTSTYLISFVAGEFVEKTETWRGIPVRFIVPKGDANEIEPTYVRTRKMLDLFSDKLAVKYPWDQYAQSSVDDFVEGGMENVSATTLTSHGLVNPQLAAEDRQGSDDLNSHELAHQWFGDLVTTKDWADLWLNEGFATYFEHYWAEQYYGADEADYEFWSDERGWFSQKNLFASPIINRESEDSLAYAGNIYTKGGWVLHMLREQLGDAAFFEGLHHYLEVNRGQNVVTADLQKAIEQATATNVDKFFHQWVYGAGAPEFAVSYTYDDAARQVKLAVKQTQKVEGRVGLFDVPIDVEIATASGRKTFPIEVSKAEETFTLPSDSAPLMVLFDKGDKILKRVEFGKSPAVLIYQLKNAETVPDRASATVALGSLKDNAGAIAALGEAAQHDPFHGVRAQALRALGKIGGPAAEKQILLTLSAEDKPWVRDVAVEELGNFKDDAGALGPKLIEVAANDKAYRVRAAALYSLGQLKAPNAYDALVAAVQSNSPDDILRNAALRSFGSLGDNRAAPLLLQWSALGKPLESRGAAINSIAELDKQNLEITKALISYLNEPYFDIKLSAVFALGRRGDPAAIAPLEALVKSGDLSLGTAPFVQEEIDALKAKAGLKEPAMKGENQAQAEAAPGGSSADQKDVMQALKNLQRQMEEVNARLTKIESRLGGEKN